MSKIFEWDELEVMRIEAEHLFDNGKPNAEKRKEFCDFMEFALCLIYAYGWKDAEEVIGFVPFKDGLDDKAVNLEIGGETFRNRVEKQIDEGSIPGILRIIDTESHRDYNTGVYDASKKSGQILTKQWMTMRDGRVRDTHIYLQGMTVMMDDLFYTYDGDSALYPGGFELPENNCNCRCWIVPGKAV